jgi:hypothetical protein|tara:strand:+ start:266 stop:472 length:207 start_codon:yes stop_codon:yes gene_type:complete
MKTNRHKRLKMKIDRLLEANAKYQANNVCVTNTPEQQKQINDHCNKEFINPIKDIDPDFFELIAKQSD